MTHLEVEEFHISIFSVYMILRIGAGFCVIYFLPNGTNLAACCGVNSLFFSDAEVWNQDLPSPTKRCICTSPGRGKMEGCNLYGGTTLQLPGLQTVL